MYNTGASISAIKQVLLNSGHTEAEISIAAKAEIEYAKSKL